MGDTRQCTFYIYLTDGDEVNRLNALYPKGLVRGPEPAAVEFSAPFIHDGDPVSYPCTRTAQQPWGGSDKFPLDRAYFTLNEGFWGAVTGRTQKYVWIGVFVYMPASEGTGTMATVVFMEGFENYEAASSNGAEGATASSAEFCRAASRLPDGLGFSLRQVDLAVQHGWTPGVFSGSEVFYLRVRAFPTAGDGCIWRVRMGSNRGLTNSGGALFVTPLGALLLRTITSGGTLSGSTVGGSGGALVLDRWYRVGISYSNGTTDVSPVEPSSEIVWLTATVSLDHRVVVSANETFTEFVSNPGDRTLDNSTIGVGIGNHNGLAVDLDDWVALSGGGGGADRQFGHHIAYQPAHVFDAPLAGWTGGDVRGLDQHSHPSQADDVFTSTTSAAALVATTRAERQSTRSGVMGAQAIQVSILSRRAGAAHGTLGIVLQRAAGDTPLTHMLPIEQFTSDRWSWALYAPAGEPEPWPITSLQLRHTKGADTSLETVKALFATILLVGVFDQCDVLPADDGEAPLIVSPASFGLHNAPYPYSIWNRTAVPPDSPAWVKAGVYTGNNLGQDIITKIPAHFWWVRATNSTAGATRWWSSMVANKWALAGGHRPGMNTALEDPDYVSAGGPTDPETQALLRVAGAQAPENLAGVIYEYLAFGDPGMRFVLNGAVRHALAVAAAANPLVDAEFLAEWGFFTTEAPAGGGFLYQKGPGHPVDGGQRIDFPDTPTQTTFAAFTAGLLTTRATLHFDSGSQAAFSLWRMRDGADYALAETPEPVPVQILTYVGDGAAVRVLTLPRVSGNRPLWALCQGTNASAYVRDPAHLADTSSLAAAGSSVITTGFIGGGIDQVLVGASLNSLGITFNLFVIMGDATAGHNGWGANTEILYDSMPAPGAQWPPGYTQEELDDIENAIPSVTCLDIYPILPTGACMTAATMVCNMALAEIGITKQMLDLGTDTTQEATTARLVFSDVLDAVLRDFPWKFATEYADLAWIAGTPQVPVNPDWRYTYALPTNCVRVRRVCDPSINRKYTPTPIPFDQRADLNGLDVLLCNEPGFELLPAMDAGVDPTITIEYTKRLACTAQVNDAQFREALVYKLGARLAKALARDSADADRCLRNYMSALPKAQTQHANQSEPQRPVTGNPDWITGR